MARYVDFDKIGSGGFGIVTKCKRDVDGKIFAKKKLNNQEGDAIKRFGREVGQSHNRWKVLGIFESMLSSLHGTDEIFLIKGKIGKLNVGNRQALRQYAHSNVSEEILNALDDKEEPPAEEQ